MRALIAAADAPAWVWPASHSTAAARHSCGWCVAVGRAWESPESAGKRAVRLPGGRNWVGELVRQRVQRCGRVVAALPCEALS